MKKTLLLLIALSYIVTANAQYNYANQWAIGVSGGIASTGGFLVGLSAHNSIGQSPHSINVGANYTRSKINNLAEITDQLILAEVYYMFSFDNIVKSSWFHVNMGAGANVGYETINNRSEVVRLDQTSGIRYGLLGKVQLDFKLTRSIAIFIEPKYTYLFNTKLIENTFTASAGLKIYL